jgi:DNA mismatch repair ATPase MutS
MQLPKPMVRYSQVPSSPFSHLNAALTDLKIAMNAMSALINYLDLTRDENNFGHFNFKQYSMGQYMRLDASAVQALSLLPNARETGSNKNMNLLGLLNKCKTAQGSRLIGQWLKQPLVNLHEISAYFTLDDVDARQIFLRKTTELGRGFCQGHKYKEKRSGTCTTAYYLSFSYTKP